MNTRHLAIWTLSAAAFALLLVPVSARPLKTHGFFSSHMVLKDTTDRNTFRRTEEAKHAVDILGRHETLGREAK